MQILVKMRFCWSGMGLHSNMTKVLLKGGGDLDTEMYTERTHVNARAGVGGLQAKDCQPPIRSAQLSKAANPAVILSLDF